jgi:hypothetical protein
VARPILSPGDCRLANLKFASGRADAAAMYFCRQPLPERGVRVLRALHVSLNAPVIAIEDLPVGPARAAIALQDAGDGGVSLLLALRSQRSGQLACFAPDETPLSAAVAQIALDGALSFAESMGFLFDGDAIPELGEEGPRAAAQSWNELLGIEPPEPEALPEPAGGEAEIWLEEAVAPPAPAAQVAAEPQAAPAPGAEPEAAAPAPPPALLLTKFRRTTGASSRNGWPIRLLSHF